MCKQGIAYSISCLFDSGANRRVSTTIWNRGRTTPISGRHARVCGAQKTETRTQANLEVTSGMSFNYLLSKVLTCQSS